MINISDNDKLWIQIKTIKLLAICGIISGLFIFMMGIGLVIISISYPLVINLGKNLVIMSIILLTISASVKYKIEKTEDKKLLKDKLKNG